MEFRAAVMTAVGAPLAIESVTAGWISAVLVLAPAHDLYNPIFTARWASASIPGARFVELPGNDGHRSASGAADGPTAVLREAIGSFMSSPPP